MKNRNNINQYLYELRLMIHPDHNFVVFDGFGDSLRSFETLDGAKEFVKYKPDCTIEEIKPLTNDQFTAIYGEPPF